MNLIDTGWSDFSLLLFTPDERQIVLIPPNDEDIQPAGDFIGFWDIQTGARVRSIDSIGPLLFGRDNFLQVRDSQEALAIFDMVSDRGTQPDSEADTVSTDTPLFRHSIPSHRSHGCRSVVRADNT